VKKRTPLYINFKFNVQIKNKLSLKALKKAIKNAQNNGLMIIHFALQSNHIHLIAQAADNETLSRGMRALAITFAKGLKRGKVQLERYHLHVLRTLQETKNAIQYVLFNQQTHSLKKISKVDGYSSVLYLPCAAKLIRNFARKKKMSLIVGDKEEGPLLSVSKSFLLMKGLEQL